MLKCCVNIVYNTILFCNKTFPFFFPPPTFTFPLPLHHKQTLYVKEFLFCFLCVTNTQKAATEERKELFQRDVFTNHNHTITLNSTYCIYTHIHICACICIITNTFGDRHLYTVINTINAPVVKPKFVSSAI